MRRKGRTRPLEVEIQSRYHQTLIHSDPTGCYAQDSPPWFVPKALYLECIVVI